MAIHPICCIGDVLKQHCTRIFSDVQRIQALQASSKYLRYKTIIATAIAHSIYDYTLYMSQASKISCHTIVPVTLKKCRLHKRSCIERP